MKLVRRKKKYYMRIVLRIVMIILCVSAGATVGVGYITIRNTNSSRQNRIFICMLNKDVEAGEVLEKNDINAISVVKEAGDLNSVTLEKCVGKQAKTALKKGTIISSGLLSTETSDLTNLRKIPYTYVKNTETLKKGDYIDVRISFPNGADFIVLSKKEVLSVTGDENGISHTLWLGMEEEEILRMSSGVVDAYLFEGAYIYASLYMNSLQEESIVNYPVNEVVEELIRNDPNIIEIAQNQKTLELRSKIYENATGKEEEERKEDEESLIYFE